MQIQKVSRKQHWQTDNELEMYDKEEKGVKNNSGVWAALWIAYDTHTLKTFGQAIPIKNKTNKQEKKTGVIWKQRL